MKSSKKILSFLMSIVIIFGTFAMTVVTASAKDLEWTYEIVNGEVHITDCINKVKDVVIPEKIDGYPVTEVSAYTFSDDGYRVTSITVPKTVRVLGDSDFQSPFLYLTDDFEMYFVDEDNKYFSSENGVLYNKDKTILISVPANSPLKDYVYPDTVVETNCDAFNSCASIETITISKNVRYLDGVDCGCFLSCDSLKKIIVKKGNENFSSDEDGVLYNEDKTKLIRFPSASPITYYSVPSYVQSVDWDAFHNCTNLICIDLNQIKSLDWRVFDGCTNLVTVEAPDTLEKVGGNDFYGCDNLTRFLYKGTYEQWKKISSDRCDPIYLFCLGDQVKDPTKVKTPVTNKNNVPGKTEVTETDTQTTVEESVKTSLIAEKNTAQEEKAVDSLSENTEDNGKALKIIIPVIVGVVVIAAVVVIVIKKNKK